MMNDSLIDELSSELKSENEEVRQTALTCLLRLGSGTKIYETVRRMSEVDASPRLRYLAKKALDKLDLKSRPEFQESRQLVAKLLRNSDGKRLQVFQRVLNGTDAYLKLELINALISEKIQQDNLKSKEDKQETKFLVDEIKIQLAKEKDLFLVAQYVKALGFFGSNREILLLQKLLNSDNSRVVANAVEALQKIDEVTAVSMVIPLLGHNDNRVRANAILLIYNQDSERAMSELLKMSTSNEVWMRSSALYCIKTLDFAEKENFLAQMLVEENDTEIMSDILSWMKSNGQSTSAIAISQKLNLASDFSDLSLQEVMNSCLQRCNWDNQRLEQATLEAASLKTKHVAQEIHDRSRYSNNLVNNKQNSFQTFKSVFQLSLIILPIFLASALIHHFTIVRKSYHLNAKTGTRTITPEDYSEITRTDYLRSSGFYAEARSGYERLLQKYPNDSNLHLAYTETLFNSNLYEDSLAHLQKNKSKINSSARYFRLLCRATLLVSKDKRQTSELYTKALALFPKDGLLLRDASEFFSAVEDTANAEKVSLLIGKITY